MQGTIHPKQIKRFYHKENLKSIVAKKVNVIIDGMNVFHAVKDKFGINLLNIDLNKLVKHISRKDENILSIKFFVSPFVGSTNVAQIQREFIERNSKLSNVHLKLGVFRKRLINCQKCANQVVHYQEKHTDINIALEISRSAIDISIDKIYLSLNGNKVAASGNFLVHAQDYGIEIPSLVKEKFANQIKVSFNFDLDSK